MTRILISDLLAVFGGFELDWVASYDAGAVGIRDGRHDVYLVDQDNWDDHSGLDLVREAVAAGHVASFILLIGESDSAVAADALEAGAADYLVKEDLDASALERSLRYALNHARWQRMELRVPIADRLVLLGVVATGLVHEINNPLSSVTSNLALISEELERLAPDLSADRLTDLLQAVQDARGGAECLRVLVRDRRAFAQFEEKPRTAVDVRVAFEWAIRMAWTDIQRRAQLLRAFGEVPKVEVEESALRQVLLNLLVNAVQAIPDGNAGWNEIRCITRVDPGGSVVIEVHDTGSGIPAENLNRIFEPFFTTKAGGIGTGLGLAACRMLVNAVGGEITVESELGRGTIFRVLLPPTKGPAVERGLPTIIRQIRP